MGSLLIVRPKPISGCWLSGSLNQNVDITRLKRCAKAKFRRNMYSMLEVWLRSSACYKYRTQPIVIRGDFDLVACDLVQWWFCNAHHCFHFATKTKLFFNAVGFLDSHTMSKTLSTCGCQWSLSFWVLDCFDEVLLQDKMSSRQSSLSLLLQQKSLQLTYLDGYMVPRKQGGSVEYGYVKKGWHAWCALSRMYKQLLTAHSCFHLTGALQWVRVFVLGDLLCCIWTSVLYV